MYVMCLNLICEIVVKPNVELYGNVHAICDFDILYLLYTIHWSCFLVLWYVLFSMLQQGQTIGTTWPQWADWYGVFSIGGVVHNRTSCETEIDLYIDFNNESFILFSQKKVQYSVLHLITFIKWRHTQV